MATVAEHLSPNELAYWMKYMTEEDKEVVYMGIAECGLWHQTWLNHKELRCRLLTEFKCSEAAATAIRDLIGFKKVPPSYFKINTVPLASLLIQVFLDGLAGKLTLFPSHLEVAVPLILHEKQYKSDLILVYGQVLRRWPEKLTRLWVEWMKQAWKEGEEIIGEEEFHRLCQQIP